MKSTTSEAHQVAVSRSPRCPPFVLFSGREIAGLARLLLDVLGLSHAGLEIELTGDREIARLNASFLGCAGPTNVLSFESDDPGGSCLGHIVLSVEAVEREARLYGQGRQEHFLRLLAHGLLHVAGFEHGEAMDELTDQAVAHGLRHVREGKMPLQE